MFKWLNNKKQWNVIEFQHSLFFCVHIWRIWNMEFYKAMLMEKPLTFCFKVKEHFWWWNCEHGLQTALWKWRSMMSLCLCSWNIGPAHIISFSTEVYFYLEYGLDLLFRQYEWLKKDLEVWSFTWLYIDLIVNDNLSCALIYPGSKPTRAESRASVDHHHGTQTHVLLRWWRGRLHTLPKLRMYLDEMWYEMQIYFNVSFTVPPILGSPWTQWHKAHRSWTWGFILQIRLTFSVKQQDRSCFMHVEHWTLSRSRLNYWIKKSSLKKWKNI